VHSSQESLARELGEESLRHTRNMKNFKTTIFVLTIFSLFFVATETKAETCISCSGTDESSPTITSMGICDTWLHGLEGSSFHGIRQFGDVTYDCATGRPLEEPEITVLCPFSPSVTFSGTGEVSIFGESGAFYVASKLQVGSLDPSACPLGTEGNFALTMQDSSGTERGISSGTFTVGEDFFVTPGVSLDEILSKLGKNLGDTTKATFSVIFPGSSAYPIFQTDFLLSTVSAGGAPPAAPYVSTPPKLEIPIPTLPNFSSFMPVEPTGEPGNRYLLIPWIGEYIGALYKYAIGIAGVLAGIMIVIAGLIWLTAGGSAERVTTAKSYIESALVGLVIALTSYVLLYAVNPTLVGFEALKVKFIERAPDVRAEGFGGFDAETYSNNPADMPPLESIPGDSPAAKAVALCKPDPGNYAARIANLKEILPQWLAICRANGCAYFKGGFTEGCRTTSGGKRMAKSMFCALKKNNLTLPPGCENYMAECPDGSDVNSPSSCWEPLSQYYHDYAAVPVCNAGLIIGDCLTWSHQLLNCAAKTKHPIAQYRSGGLPASEYLVFGANGIDAAIAEINTKGGLKYGDLFWSNAFGHNFMYTDNEIVEMGGFGAEKVTVPGVGSFGTVKTHPFDWYLQTVRGRERGKPDIKTYIHRPYDF